MRGESYGHWQAILPDVRERAVRMLLDLQSQHESWCTAILLGASIFKLLVISGYFRALGLLAPDSRYKLDAVLVPPHTLDYRVKR